MNAPKNDRKRDDTSVLKLFRFVAPEPTIPARLDETISGVVQRAVEEECQAAPEPVIAPKDAPIAPKGLLGILAYCYAKRIYGSEEIQDKLGHSPEVVAACHNSVPDASFLRRFRRLNRALLQKCLEKALRRSPRHAVTTACAPKAGAETTTTVIHREAEERLDKAAFVDGMSNQS